MSMKQHVTIKQFDSTGDATAAEALLKENGVPQEMITRKGKTLSVDEAYANQARGLFAAVTPAGDTPSVGDHVQQAASATADAAGAAASAVTDTAQEVTSTVVDTAKQAASTVTDKVQDVTSTVTDKVQDVTSKVADTAATKVEQLADTARQGAIQPTTPAAQREGATTAANVLDRTASYLREGNATVILDDLRDVVRRHPLRSLALGLGLGYMARNTFFGGASAQAGGGRQSIGAQVGSTPPRAVPVFSATTTGSGPSPMLGTGLPGDMSIGYGSSSTTLGDIQSPLVEDSVADSLLYGADTAMPGDLTDDDLLDSDLGAAGSHTLTGDIADIGSAGTSSTLSDAGFGATAGSGADIGSSGTSSMVSDASLGQTAGNVAGSPSALSAGSPETSVNGSPWQSSTVDVVKQWNANTGTSDS